VEDVRLQTAILVSAVIRKCNCGTIPIYVHNKGAEFSGTIIVKIVKNIRDCKIFSQTRDDDGNIAWVDIYEDEAVDESHADEYIKRSIDRDPDLWVIEVEDASGNNPFEGKIV